MPFPKPLLAVAAAAPLILAACGAAADRPAAGAPPAAFARWDTDNDGSLTDAEFTAAARGGVYEPWNTNGGDGLDGGELAAGLARVGDRDRDGRIAGDEMWVTEQRPSNQPGLEYGGLPDAGARPGGSLTLDGVRDRLGRPAVLRTWDTDGNGTVSAEELGRGLMALLDANHDGSVDAAEWRAKLGDAGWQ